MIGGVLNTLWGFVPSHPFGATSEEVPSAAPVPVVEAPAEGSVEASIEEIQEVAQKVIVKQGCDLPSFVIFNDRSRKITIETLGTDNTTEELFDALASKMECTADKISIFMNPKGNVWRLFNFDEFDNGSIGHAISMVHPWGIIGAKWLFVSKDV